MGLLGLGMFPKRDLVCAVSDIHVLVIIAWSSPDLGLTAQLTGDGSAGLRGLRGINHWSQGLPRFMKGSSLSLFHSMSIRSKHDNIGLKPCQRERARHSLRNTEEPVHLPGTSVAADGGLIDVLRPWKPSPAVREFLS